MRKEPGKERFEEISLLLAQAFGEGAEGIQKQEIFLSQIPEGQQSPRRLMLLGDEVSQNDLKKEIKQLVKKSPAAPQI